MMHSDPKKPVVGIAWTASPGETYAAIYKAIELAGGQPVPLGQVRSAALRYDEEGRLLGDKDADGMLTVEAADRVRRSGWRESNAAAVMAGIPAVVFPGGGDICPSLYRVPQPLQTREGVDAERDVSDCLLMEYCLDRDIPLLAICRGMQVLAVVCGAEMIQDIPAYLRSLGRDDPGLHRREPEQPGGECGWRFHDVAVTERESLLYRLTGLETIPNVPSWHHQAVRSVAGTALTVTGVTETGGAEIIEAVERRDKTFALGLQCHPEISAARGLDELSKVYFEAIVREAAEREKGENA